MFLTCLSPLFLFTPGVVARNVDALGTVKAPCLGRDLRRILYRGASASLTLPGTGDGESTSTGPSAGAGAGAGAESSAFPSPPTPPVDPALPEMHIHALVLNQAVQVGDIGPDTVAPEGVLHLDCKATKIMTFELEVFAITQFAPHNG